MKENSLAAARKFKRNWILANAFGWPLGWSAILYSLLDDIPYRLVMGWLPESLIDYAIFTYLAILSGAIVGTLQLFALGRKFPSKSRWAFAAVLSHGIPWGMFFFAISQELPNNAMYLVALGGAVAGALINQQIVGRIIEINKRIRIVLIIQQAILVGVVSGIMYPYVVRPGEGTLLFMVQLIMPLVWLVVGLIYALLTVPLISQLFENGSNPALPTD